MEKIIFKDICDQHLKWDKELTENVRERWRRFVKNLPDKTEVPHSISKEGEIQETDLHAFGHAKSVALYWIKGENRHKQFVINQVSKIKEKQIIEWRQVP